jgi:hypothetical protein
VVAGGPESGRRIPLTTGVHRVGREAAVALDDPSVSTEHLVVTVAEDGAVSVADAGSRASTRHVPAPPNDPHRSRLPLGASLIPLVLGVGLYLLTHLPTMLFFSLLAPVMAVTTYVEDRRGGRKGFERQRVDYRRRLAELRTELDAERRAEVARRRAEAPSAPELLRRAQRLEPTLWERRPMTRTSSPTGQGKRLRGPRWKGTALRPLDRSALLTERRAYPSPPPPARKPLWPLQATPGLGAKSLPPAATI